MKRGTRRSNNGYIGYDQTTSSLNGIIGSDKIYAARTREFPFYAFGNTANTFGLNGGNYQRPSDWPALPSVTAGSQQIAGLFAVFNNESNVCAVQIQGAYSVDWGDGTSGTFANNAIATKRYDQASYAGLTSSVVTSRGGSYKTALIRITPQAGQTFTTAVLSAIPSGVTGINSFHSNNWLDIRMSAPSLTTLTVSNWYFNAISARMLEQFEFIGTAPLTSFTFISCSSLKKIVAFPSTRNMSSWASNFHTCFDLQEIPATILDSFVTGRATGASNYVFYLCRTLDALPVAGLNTRNLTSMEGFFLGMNSLKQCPSLDTSACTNLSNLFGECASLEEIPFLDTRRVTNFGSMLAGCRNLRRMQDELQGASGTNFSFMFQNTNLKKFPRINTINGTNFQGMFQANPVVQTIPQYDYSKATDLSSFARYADSINTLPPFNTTTALTTTQYMFEYAYSLQSCPSIANMTNVTNTQGMFTGCWSLRTIPSITMGNATTNANMFDGTQALLSVGMTGISFACNFTNCMMGPTALNNLFTSLATVGVSGANARNITITGNWGACGSNAPAAAVINRSIAIGKGWNVIG